MRSTDRTRLIGSSQEYVRRDIGASSSKSAGGVGQAFQPSLRFRVDECVLSDSTDKVAAFNGHGARHCRDPCVDLWRLEELIIVSDAECL